MAQASDFTRNIQQYLVVFNRLLDVATVHTNGTEDDLYSNTLAANLFANPGDVLYARYTLTYASTPTPTEQTRAYFAGNLVLDSGALTFASGGTAIVEVEILCVSSTGVRVTAEYTASGITLQPIITYTPIGGLTLTGTNVLKITGTPNGAGGVITAVQGKSYLVPAA